MLEARHIILSCISLVVYPGVPVSTRMHESSGLPSSRVPVLHSTVLLAEILGAFEDCYVRFQAEGFAPIMQQWRALSDIIGQRVTVDVLGTRHVGIVEDVDNDGVLVLRDDQNQHHRIFFRRCHPGAPLKGGFGIVLMGNQLNAHP